MTNEKTKYELVNLTENEVLDAQFNLDSTKYQLISAEAKLEIQNYKIKKEIPQLEAKEELDKIEESLCKIKESIENLDKNDEKYEEKKLRMEYDLFCGEKEFEKAKYALEKRISMRLANKFIRKLEDECKLHKDNLKVFAEQVRTKKKKVPIYEKNIQLDD